MVTSNLSIPLFCCLVFIGGLGQIFAQSFDISSGGMPTITGALGGSITGSSNIENDLVVTVNFGEVSPTNTNGIVKVVVPISIRSLKPYRVTAIVTGSVNPNPQALQFSDVGFGVKDLRMVGSEARICTKSDHIIYSPFNNDPTSNVSINGAGRAGYVSSLNNVLSSTTILSGPILSKKLDSKNQSGNEWVFDAILAITPQFYSPGSFTATLTFTISEGATVAC